jgi:hypothetical protein
LGPDAGGVVLGQVRPARCRGSSRHVAQSASRSKQGSQRSAMWPSRCNWRHLFLYLSPFPLALPWWQCPALLSSGQYVRNYDVQSKIWAPCRTRFSASVFRPCSRPISPFLPTGGPGFVLSPNGASAPVRWAIKLDVTDLRDGPGNEHRQSSLPRKTSHEGAA